MRYPESRHDQTLATGIVFATKWLRSNALPAGGWSRAKDQKTSIWLPGTMVAVHALERLGIYSSTALAHEIQALTKKARDHIVENGLRTSGNRMHWTQIVGGNACPGATSLAVLTLARGSEHHRDAARAGIEWLSANRELWTRHVHIDNLIDKRLWRIQSFSLGLRALMHPCGERDVGDPAVAEVVSHFNSLWRDGNHGWADEPGLEASMSGGYAVISAVQTLKRVWDFDPYEHLGILMQHRGKVKSPPPRAPRILNVCTNERSIRIEDDRGDLILQTRLGGKAQWPFVLMLANRHHEAVSKGTTNKTEMTISLDEYARALKTKPESVIRTRRRLHEKLVKEARKLSQRAFVELVEDHFPPETTELRFALEEIEVHFVDTLPTVQRVTSRVSSGHIASGVSDSARRLSLDKSATKIPGSRIDKRTSAGSTPATSGQSAA
jgi:hypothetical protein